MYCMFQFIAGRLFGDLMIGGLVFISGYTHFIYHWKHGNFTWKRLATVSNAWKVHISKTVGPDTCTCRGCYFVYILYTVECLYFAGLITCTCVVQLVYLLHMYLCSTTFLYRYCLDWIFSQFCWAWLWVQQVEPSICLCCWHWVFSSPLSSCPPGHRWPQPACRVCTPRTTVAWSCNYMNSTKVHNPQHFNELYWNPPSI